MDLPTPPAEVEYATLARRLGAAFYDGMIVLTLQFFAGFGLVALHNGDAFAPGDPWVRLALLGVAALFFCGFWMRGETLGMRAWRLRVRARGGGRVNLGSAFLRFVAALLSWACLGLGFWAALRDPQRRTWHDRLSGTELIVVSI